MAELFGFEIKRKTPIEEPHSFVERQEDDGAIAVAAGGSQATFVDLEGTAQTESDLIYKYRTMMLNAEVNSAVDDIVNEAINVTNNEAPVTIVVDDIPFTDGVKKKIIDEFNYCLQLLDFSNTGYEKFKQWYVDGRSNYHVIIDESQPKRGIIELRYIDSPKIRKIKEYEQVRDGQAYVKKLKNEYFLYLDNSNIQDMGKFTGGNVLQGLKIAKDSIISINSGLVNEKNTLVLSYLHQAYKALNQLRMLEDAAVIYRIARAPERRAFYIDVGNLPKAKADQYLRDMMTRHKNKLAYNAATGEIRDDRNFMTMTDDYWLPRREGGRGTEIQPLAAGANLGEMTDVEYMQKKLYKALRVPVSRLESDSMFNVGRSSEISRDEVKFSKFVRRLRNRFAMLFDRFLEKQLVLKGIITPEDWNEIKNKLRYDFQLDNHFEELKHIEVLRERVSLVNDILPLVEEGYFSKSYVKKHVLYQSEEEIEEIKKEKEEEKAEERENDLIDAVHQDAMSDDDEEEQGQGAPTTFTATLKPAAPTKPKEEKLK
ncbi:portal vertex protein of head [Sinorhizobium phage phiM7]|uniref:Portal protein n=2 Tax=Emdodecavirus TaxID=1980937 RepID=S5MAR0_9CAUD|nr:portal vertex protein of head [Sinorhizobium phage phiM12]YP_009601178.1 portal vertex protein of head [Sinorhizobium phage phiM7]AGR47703.1 portal vertex protein of head [Sinorhizobium phage phiM12]AKF12601.1 portal vertex protein of head [Sinorhizobium phage phiM7]AKF12961.1 portal vertex protein of head [Sinorhizobium phage phiM19]